MQLAFRIQYRNLEDGGIKLIHYRDRDRAEEEYKQLIKDGVDYVELIYTRSVPLSTSLACHDVLPSTLEKLLSPLGSI